MRLQSLALLGFTALVACSPNDPPAPTHQQATHVVTVSEGTNMSLAVSPDGQTLALSVQGKLFTLPINGGMATAIVDDYYDAREPSWSPDGQRIVFHGYRGGTWDLWEVSLNGGEVQQLTNDAFDDREPHYAPDGRSIAFSSDRAGSYDVWVLNLDDGGLQQVTDTQADEHSPAWSPDGQRIAYAVTIGRNEGQLRHKSVDGDPITLAEEAGNLAGISWSPDGTELAYQVLRRTGAAVTELRLVSLEGGPANTLSQSGDDVFPFRASWIDADTLVYAANGQIRKQRRDAAPGVVPFSAAFELNRQPYSRRTRDHDDSQPRQALGIVAPAISPDGREVAFTALGDVWLWNPEAGTLENLTDNVFAEQTPTWSQDGSKLAYISDRAGSSGLWVYDFAQQRHRHVPVQASGVSNPRFAPDGESIAVFAATSNPLAGQLAIVDLEDGSHTPLYKPIPPQPVSWSADGTVVATTSLAPYSNRYREGVYQLVVANASGGEVNEVVPTQHRNVTDVSLIPSGQAITYVQGGLLWQLDLDETYRPVGEPRQLTNELTDNPSWSAGGQYIVYMSGDRMVRFDATTATAEDITPSLQYARAQPSGRQVIRIGRLFDGVRDGYQTNVDLVIEGNRIVSVGPADPDLTPDIDASSHAAFPGLFEMHAHMGVTSEKQGRVWLAYGVTTVRDPGSNPYLAKERQEAWDSGRLTGPRTHVTGYLTDGNRVYYSMAEGIISDAHLMRSLHRVEVLGLDFIKTYVRLPDHWQREVVEFAHGIGIPVSSHELYPAVAHGSDHVEHIGGTSRRGYQPKVTALGHSYDDVIRLLVDSGMGITATAVLPGYSVVVGEQPDLFATDQFEAFYGASMRQAAQMLVRMFGPGATATAEANGELLRALVDEDALLVTGTDSPFVPYGAGLHAEFRLYERAGIAPRDILRASTIKSAQAVGVADDLGTLEVGKLADFVVVDGDPLAQIRDADNVVFTVKNGVVYPLAELIDGPE
ncbi:MAG: amidohydrolase family protein [Gammaproteobacteria bacterium]|nr:amidohydrolase family protein [Gammaproteobacteria bacterium]